MYITEAMDDFQKDFPKLHEAMDDLVFGAIRRIKSFYDLSDEEQTQLINAYIADMIAIDMDWLFGVMHDVKASLNEALNYNRFDWFGKAIQREVKNSLITKFDQVMYDYEDEMMTPLEKKRRGRFYGMPDIEIDLLDGTAFR